MLLWGLLPTRILNRLNNSNNSKGIISQQMNQQPPKANSYILDNVQQEFSCSKTMVLTRRLCHV
jgi:hypothetical protein